MQLSGLPCPGQGMSNVITHAEVMIEKKTGDVVYPASINAGIMGKQLLIQLLSVLLVVQMLLVVRVLLMF